MGGCGHQFTVVHRPNIEYHLCPSRSNLINGRQTGKLGFKTVLLGKYYFAPGGDQARQLV